MDPKIQSASDYAHVAASSTYTVPKGRYAKACRVDQAGVITFTSNAGTLGTWNCLQGEVINLGVRVTVTTDSTAVVQVYL